MAERILRVAEVLERLSIGRTFLYALIKGGQFPKQIKLGGKVSGWLESEVNAWIKEQADKRL